MFTLIMFYNFSSANFPAIILEIFLSEKVFEINITSLVTRNHS